MTHTPANTPASGGDEPGDFASGTLERLIQRLEDAAPDGPYICDADREEAAEIAAQEMARAWGKLKPCPEEGMAEHLCSFPSCNCSADRLPYPALAAPTPQADGGVVPAGWRPISTAKPKHNDEALGWGSLSGYSAARYIMRWFDAGGDFNGKTGWWTVNCLPFEPTHWQSLPSPPDAAAPPLNTGSAVGGGGGGETITWELAEERKRADLFVAKLNEAEGYATRLAQSLSDKHYPNPDWRPLPDLYGVLTQIDNMTTVMVRAPAPAEAGDDLAGQCAREKENAIRVSAARIGMAIEAHKDDPGHEVYAKSTVYQWQAVLARLTPASRPAEQGEPVADLSKLVAALDELTAAAEAWAERGGDQAHRILPLIHPSFNAVYEAYKPLRGVLTAPAASRPAVVREEIAWSLLCSLRTDITEPKLRELLATEERLSFSKPWHTAWEVARRQADAVLALLDPRDDTRAGGAEAQEGGR